MATKKPAPKKSAPAKKAIPAKAPIKKVAAPAKKATPAKAPIKKVAAPAKKSAPVKKATPAKASVKKVTAPAKKAAPVKKAAPAKAPAKPVAKSAPAKASIKKAAPAKPVAKSVPTKAPVKKAAAPAKAPAKPVAKPTAAPAKKAAASAKAPVKVVAKPAPVKPAAPVKPVEKYVPPAKPVPKIPTPPVKPVRKAAEPIKDIKVPKISAKGSVPYQPGYVSMEKRKEVERSTDTLIRYTDAELAEFKEVVLKKLEETKIQVAYYKEQMRHSGAMGGDFDDAKYMTMEDGTVSMERELFASSVSQKIGFIQKLEFALMRIENKTYGICRLTGMKIPKERLLVHPAATTTVAGKESESK
jgi:RNA polymerase-binding transcription factor DksA